MLGKGYGKALLFLLLVFMAPAPLYAGVYPKEGSVLNYRIAGFSWPGKAKAVKYIVELARGAYADTAAFSKNVFTSFTSAKNKMIFEVPDFGTQYTWRIKAVMAGGATVADTALHSFSTGSVPDIDPNTTRIRVMHEAEKYQDAYVFADCNRALYDMKGNPVWYMPVTDSVLLPPRDLKLSPNGTITMMQEDEAAFEINYNGDVLWRSPRSGQVSGDTTEHCHHDFTKLKNGHYMMLGKQTLKFNLPAMPDTVNVRVPGTVVMKDTDGVTRQQLEFGTVIEYDHEGKVVWSWKSSEYFMRSDLVARKTATGLYDMNDTHENAFYFDEAGKMLYVSFRNISRILKVQYPSGKVVAEYGTKYAPGVDVAQGQLFCFQHCCRRSSKGLLYLFDNNDCSFPDFPKILMMQESATAADALKKVWEFSCDIMPVPATARKSRHFKSGGGSVYELPDHAMLVCMNFIYTGLFIVSPDKQILWSALAERWNPASKSWSVTYEYRASMVTRRQLEKLVWDSEAGEK